MLNEIELAQDIRRLVGETNPNVFVVEVKLHRSKRSVLSLLVDTFKGITIDECAKLSRVIGSFLETREGMDFAYSLEVSSPGVNEPLKLPIQYKKNIGRKLRVMLLDGTTYIGTLRDMSENSIFLLPDSGGGGKAQKKPSKEVLQPLEIQLDMVKSAKVLVSFN